MTISAIYGAEPTISLTSQVIPATKASSLPSLVEKPFYFSPTLTVDPKTGNAVLEIRNSETGKVTAQYPNQSDVEAYAPRSLKPEQSSGTSTGTVVGNSDVTTAVTAGTKTATPPSTGVVATAPAASPPPANSIVI